MHLHCVSFFPHLLSAYWRHSCGTEMPCVSVVLVVDVIVMAIGGVILLMLAREASLHTLVHGRTLQSLLWHLSLVVQTLVHQLLMHLVRLVLPRSAHHVPSRWTTSVILLLRPHVKVIWSTSLSLVAV